MVFITMEQDDALSRTARYQVQYTQDSTSQPPTCPYSHNNHNNTDPSDDLPFSHVFDRELSRVITIRHRADGTISRFHYPGLDSDDDEDPSSTTIHADHLPHRRSWQSRFSNTNTTSSTHRRHPSMPSEFSSNHPDFQITTECSDDEDDPSAHNNNPSRRAIPRPAPNRIGSLPFETDSDSDSDPLLLNTTAPPTTTTDTPSESLLQAWEAHARATQEAVRAVGGGQLLVPHARFFIEKRKSKCTIRFDPPVSGRFILLKMWSSHQEVGGNIDIQSVIARGFAGPRYFPSVELR
jgi:hypothetical protein